jgi:RimJ/RimL family protein N-acetyltransferase
MIGASGAWVLVSSSDERYVGLVTLIPHDLGLELSYQLFEEFWGEGLAMEATSAVLGAARDGSSQRIVAITQKVNKDSRKLLGRLGFSEKEEFVEFGEVQLLSELPR